MNSRYTGCGAEKESGVLQHSELELKGTGESGTQRGVTYTHTVGSKVFGLDPASLEGVLPWNVQEFELDSKELEQG